VNRVGARAERERDLASLPLRAPPHSQSAPIDVNAALLALDAKLAAGNVPALSSYWKGEAARFYGHQSARTLVECVGRGGDKSRTSTKMAIAETLFGAFDIPPGERHYYTHVAENRDEASKTLGVLEQYLRVLSVPFERAGDTIELGRLPRGIKVLACRVGAVSGWRCIGWTADECAKWSSEGADPTSEVLTSIRAMTVTHPSARGRIFSSPMGILGHFYEAWSRGNTDAQLVGWAPTWVANPTVTEARTRELERDERRWRREYGAEPTQDTDQSMFSATLLERATRKHEGDVQAEAGVSYVAAMDPGFVRNPWTFVIAGKRLVNGRVKRSVVLAREWRGTDAHPNDPRRILREIAPLCRLYSIDGVYTDQYEKYGLQAIAEEPGIDLSVWVHGETGEARLARYEDLQMKLSDDEIELPRNLQMRADLLAVTQRQTTAGGFTVHLPETSDGRHADYAPSVTLALHKCFIDPVVTEVPPEVGTPAYYAAEQQRLLASMHKQWQNRKDEAADPYA